MVDLSDEIEVGLDPSDNFQMVINQSTGLAQPLWPSNSNLLAKVSHMLLHVAEMEEPQHRFDWTFYLGLFVLKFEGWKKDDQRPCSQPFFL